MKKHKKLSTDIALLIFLAMAVSLIIFPILGNAPVNAIEAGMLDALSTSDGPGDIGTIFNSTSFFHAAYLRIVELLAGLMPFAGNVLLVRLPGAMIVLAMTLCLFRFDGGFDRLSSSFLASLLFLSCTIVVSATFHASPILIPASLFIFAMMSLYHWLHHHTKRYFWLVVFSASLAVTMIGASSTISMAIMAYTFIAASQLRAWRKYVTITAALLLSCAVAFLSVYVVVGDSSAAMRIFIQGNILTPLPATGFGILHTFILHLVVGIFPWAIPLLISLPWILSNPRRILRHFKHLSLLQRFGVIIFLYSLPMIVFFPYTLSEILFITSIFFNMPLIGKYLLLQFNQHPSVWKITGVICATIIGLGSCCFVAENLGCDLPGISDLMTLHNGWSRWCVFITSMIFVSLYMLWRSVREIGNNNRFIYNIILLYMLAVVLAVGYILVP